MEAVGKPTGLVRRVGSTSWYFRQRWPKRYSTSDTPPDVWITLDTPVYRVALDRLDDARQEAQRRFREGSRAPPPSGIFSRTGPPTWPSDPGLPLLTPDQAAPLAVGMFANAMRAMDTEPALDFDSDELFSYRVELEDRHQRLIRNGSAGDIDEVNGVQVAVLRGAGLRAERDSPASERLRNYLHRAMIQVAAIRLARLDGNFTDQITDSLFNRRVPPELVGSAAPRRRSEAALGVVIDRYQAETLDNVTDNPKTALKHRAALALIAAFFGRETQVCDIDRAACTRFRDMLAKLPPNSTKISKGQSLAEIAERNVGKPTLAWATQRHYLKMMERLLGWCLTERLLPDNVAANIPPLKRRETGKLQRLPFQGPELREIFAAPTFTGCVDDTYRFAKAGPNVIRRSRYWLPLLGLFAGMRMGEILHLTPDHVRTSAAGTPFIVLTRDMKLKNGNAEREIPIHPTLIKLGFLSWVEDRRREGASDLFDDVPTTKHGYRSDIFTKRFRTFLDKIDLPNERRPLLCFHSFRHTFKDALNDTLAPEAEMDETCGWARAKKQGRKYGTGLSADRLKPFVDLVKFDVDLRHLELRGRH